MIVLTYFPTETGESEDGVNPNQSLGNEDIPSPPSGAGDLFLTMILSNGDSSLLEEDSVITNVNNDGIDNSEVVNSHLRGAESLYGGWGAATRRGCLWSVYVCVVLVGLLLVVIFIMGGILMRIMVEDPMRMKEPLNLRLYSKEPSCICAYNKSPGVTCGVDSKEQVRLEMLIELSHPIMLHTVSLMLPESDYNRNLGIFQVIPGLLWLILDGFCC
ncbi:hypothetical protein HAX54_050226 [Datura stramonium]|uniref:Uncharacterized protein n=1 Tax=Datura stramonium TaxID=4076 RepID=A0ABS8WNQ6_DATST|nr:hypothetical protein [Datura stramonium]